MKKIITYLILLSLFKPSASPQSAPTDPIVGIWRGSSLCQVKPSPCHDETVVYYVSKIASEKTYTIQMNKIVKGAEEEMGAVDFVYNNQKQTLRAETKDRQGRVGVWLFKIEGKQMHGTLTLSDGTLYRVIEAKKND